ncbi:PfkB family carbohydrate kinase [Desulfovibrio sp.]|uniref:PfkB family carbohydrate kinase n=1 Tax=Desulfovibrio sp. TaxID=885 RepID=UPI0025BFC869|nr:PfkB family carbohydrate kinase [Desulfovibrio sp.]
MVKFAILGSAHLSLISRVQGYADISDRPGELEFSYGGAGFNLATTLVRLGANATLGTILSDTSMSRMIVGDLQRAGVVVRPEFRKGLPEAGYSAHVTESGDVLSAVTSTPVSKASFRQDYLVSMVREADVVVLECNLSSDTLIRATKIANEAKKPVWVGGVSEVKALKILDLHAAECRLNGLFLNETELAGLLSASSAAEQPSELTRRFGQRVLARASGLGLQPFELAGWLGGAVIETRGKAGVAVWEAARAAPIAEYMGPRQAPAGAAGGSIWQGAGDQLMAMTLYLMATEQIGVGEAACRASQTISESPRQFLNASGPNPLEAKISSLRDAALLDPLTSLVNRRGLDDWLTQHDSQAEMSLLLLDIDHFKKVNDQFGHDVGDNVLRRIGAIISNALRTSDCGCRWGGEEMIAVLPYTGLPGALEVAERLRRVIETHQFAHGRVTCSVGVATGTMDTLEATREASDQALYQAKKSGRNRVVAADRSESELQA